MPDCRETCAYHEDRNRLMETMEEEISERISPTVNQHKAYWKFFFWGAGASLTVMTIMTVNINSAVTDIEASVSRMERNVAIGQVDHANNVRRLENVEDNQDEIGDRVRDLEIAN